MVEMNTMSESDVRNYSTEDNTGNYDDDRESADIVQVEKNPKISSLFSDYCDSSSIHGIRYLGRFEKPLYERALWLLVIGLCVYGSIKFSLDVYEKWDNHPIIVTFEDTSTPINQIPFPAVTICPGIKVKSKRFNFTDIYLAILNGTIQYDGYNVNLTDSDFDIIESLRNVKGCRENDELNKKKIYKKMNRTIVHVLLDIIPDFNEIFHTCWWEDKEIDCKKLWKRTLTMDGICYTFNTLGNKNLFTEKALHDDYIVGQYEPKHVNWDPETGYMEDSNDTEYYPRRVVTAGFEVGLYVELKGSVKDLDLNCGGYFPGFKMMIHAPNELADAEKNFVRVPFSNEVLVAIKPNMRSTSMDLKSIPYKKRQCFFESERNLKFFKSYTEINCLLECRGNYSVKLCGCSEFNVPRTNDTRVCDVNDHICLRDSFHTLQLNESKSGECHCLPACTAIKYNMEVSTSEIAQTQTDDFNKMKMTDTESDQNIRYATLTVFFKEDQFWSAKRSALFGTTEVMANCGGVLGLFLGVSVLSLIEILYFLSFRLIRFYIMKRSKSDVKHNEDHNHVRCQEFLK